MSKSRKKSWKTVFHEVESPFFFPPSIPLQRKEIKTTEIGAKIGRKSRKSILPRGNNFDNKLSNRANGKNIYKLRFTEIMVYVWKRYRWNTERNSHLTCLKHCFHLSSNDVRIKPLSHPPKKIFLFYSPKESQMGTDFK